MPSLILGPTSRSTEWTRTFFHHPHPGLRLDHTTVVEDTTTGRIVSTVFPIPQRWSYAGTPLVV